LVDEQQQEFHTGGAAGEQALNAEADQGADAIAMLIREQIPVTSMVNSNFAGAECTCCRK